MTQTADGHGLDLGRARRALAVGVRDAAGRVADGFGEARDGAVGDAEDVVLGADEAAHEGGQAEEEEEDGVHCVCFPSLVVGEMCSRRIQE